MIILSKQDYLKILDREDLCPSQLGIPDNELICNKDCKNCRENSVEKYISKIT